MIAGVLHDTVEDTDATLEEITELFGRDIAFLKRFSAKIVGRKSPLRKEIFEMIRALLEHAERYYVLGEGVRMINCKMLEITKETYACRMAKATQQSAKITASQRAKPLQIKANERTWRPPSPN